MRTGIFRWVVVVAAIWNLSVEAAGQTAAPSTLNPGLMDYVTSYSPWQHKLVLYSGDGTYQDVSDQGSGTYSYAVDAGNPTSATITHNPIGGSSGATSLYLTFFSGLGTGSYVVNAKSATSARNERTSPPWLEFYYYPLQNQSGATNVSTRCYLQHGTDTIVGFIVSGGLGAGRSPLPRSGTSLPLSSRRRIRPAGTL